MTDIIEISNAMLERRIAQARMTILSRGSGDAGNINDPH